jgi:hypothetical protein
LARIFSAETCFKAAAISESAVLPIVVFCAEADPNAKTIKIRPTRPRQDVFISMKAKFI